MCSIMCNKEQDQVRGRGANMESNSVPKNIQRLADYINEQPEPERTLWVLSSLIKPRTDNVHDGDKEV